MPYKMKNRFLILGLTGPLSSGCTQTARFLSGYSIYGKKIDEVLKDQTTENQFDNLNKRIRAGYENTNKLKERISSRKSKKLGPYWGAMVDDLEDQFVKNLERELGQRHARLKIYLRRREVLEVLKDLVKDGPLIYKNVNKRDHELFGFSPFIYISFTDIITKIAIESFMGESGKDLFERYFADKISRGKEEEKSAFITLKNYFYKYFDLNLKTWKEFHSSNEFIISRAYQIYFGNSDFLIKDKFIESTSRSINGYYGYFEYIKNSLELVKSPKDTKNDKEYHFALSEVLQDWGDNIRFCGNPFKKRKENEPIKIEKIYNLANEVNNLIKFLRFRIRFMNQNYEICPKSGAEDTIPALFVIECFRNPFEVDYFRSRYSEFYLLSLYADQEKRKKRIKYFSTKRDERDQGKHKKTGEVYKLDVTSCVLLSDISILNNVGTNEEEKKSFFEFFEKLMRYLAVIRMPGCVPPEADELFMHLAYSMSLMSTCISRKVGAVIVGPKGYIYGAGWNDVSEGQIGCGLRQVEDYRNIDFFPNLDPVYKLRFMENLDENSKYLCFKDALSELEIGEKMKEIEEEKTCSQECIERINEKLKLKKLEYCRALHAEENALLQTTKVGGMPVLGGSIYTTTFPCELCAKKIYQTGIKTIYFTEPYPKSISKVLLEDGKRKIEIRPFEGVKSNSFYKLFKPVFEKKDYEIITRDIGKES